MNHALVLSSPGNQSKMIVCILEFVFVRAGMKGPKQKTEFRADFEYG